MISCFLDVETTGFDFLRNDIISLACIIQTDDSAIEFVGYARPGSNRYWSYDAEKVHGFSFDEAMSFPSQKELCNNFIEFVRPYSKLNFWCHALGLFDWKFLIHYFLKNNMEWEIKTRFQNPQSTIPLAKSKLQLPNYKLNTIASYLNIELDHHEVLSDARACHQIWSKLK